MSDFDFSRAKVIPVLPDHFDPKRGDSLPEGLVGAEIVRFGTVAKNRELEGGGLVIDYRPAGAEAECRVAFAFNELGMWVAWTGPLETVPNQDATQ